MVLVDAECTHDGSVKHIQKFEFWQSADGWPCRSGLEPQNLNMLQGCRSVDEFERLNTINEGTYGIVSRAKDLKTGETVALKKVKMEKEREGFPINVAWTAFTFDLWASVFGLRNVKDTRGKRRALVC